MWFLQVIRLQTPLCLITLLFIIKVDTRWCTAKFTITYIWSENINMRPGKITSESFLTHFFWFENYLKGWCFIVVVDYDGLLAWLKIIFTNVFKMYLKRWTSYLSEKGQRIHRMTATYKHFMWANIIYYPFLFSTLHIFIPFVFDTTCISYDAHIASDKTVHAQRCAFLL
jgi:hypothetical protein